MKASGIEKKVIKDITARQQLGINKYKTTVKGNPLALKEWLQHAYEESLDTAVYLKRAIFEIEQNSKPSSKPTHGLFTEPERYLSGCSGCSGCDFEDEDIPCQITSVQFGDCLKENFIFKIKEIK